MPNLQLHTACEGPLALNDNAFELCRDFLKPQGDRFFQQVSRYDDYQAEGGQEAGIQGRRHLEAHPALLEGPRCSPTPESRLIPGKTWSGARGRAVFQFLHRGEFPIFEISTSYRPVRPGGGAWLGFKTERIFALSSDLDRYPLSPMRPTHCGGCRRKSRRPRRWSCPPRPPPLGLRRPRWQEALARLDRIFWERLRA